MNQSEKNQIKEDARRYIWHPFTQMKEWEADSPIIVEYGKGAYLYDIDGNRYLDGVSSLWVNLHGHRKTELDQAIRRQLGKIAHSTLLGLTNIPAVKLAKELVKRAPKGLTKVFYSDNGSTAVEIALKMALQYWQHQGQPQKIRYLSLMNAYHGDTIGSVSVGGIDLFHKRYSPLLFPTFKVDSPYCYRCFLGKTYPQCQLSCADEVEKVLQSHHEEIAAVIVEPLLQGATGMIVWPSGYLSRIRELCTRYGVFLIADEVLTGFGRTGRMFACEHEDVTPDFMAIAKGLSGGYVSLAATLTTQKIYDAFLGRYDEFKTFFHGHSYTGNQLACAVSLANLKVFDKENILHKLKEKIARLNKELLPLWDYPHVGDIRQIGLIAGIELVQNKQTKDPYPLSERMGMRVAHEARKRGMLIRPLGNVLVLMPPLSVNPRTLRKMVKIISESIQVATSS